MIAALSVALLLDATSPSDAGCPAVRELPAPPADCVARPPLFPPDAMDHRLAGEVLVEVTISASGTLVAASVLRSGPTPLHDRVALSFADRRCWGVHDVDGEPSCYTATLPIRFDPADQPR